MQHPAGHTNRPSHIGFGQWKGRRTNTQSKPMEQLSKHVKETERDRGRLTESEAETGVALPLSLRLCV